MAGSPAESMMFSCPVAPVWKVSFGSWTLRQVRPPSKLVYAKPDASLRASRVLNSR